MQKGSPGEPDVQSVLASAIRTRDVPRVEVVELPRPHDLPLGHTEIQVGLFQKLRPSHETAIEKCHSGSMVLKLGEGVLVSGQVWSACVKDRSPGHKHERHLQWEAVASSGLSEYNRARPYIHCTANAKLERSFGEGWALRRKQREAVEAEVEDEGRSLQAPVKFSPGVFEAGGDYELLLPVDAHDRAWHQRPQMADGDDRAAPRRKRFVRGVFGTLCIFTADFKKNSQLSVA